MMDRRIRELEGLSVQKKTMALLMSLMVLLALALTGCGGDKKDAPKKAESKVLRVGTNASFAPFEFQDEKTKEYAGFDMDLIRAVGKQLGMEVQIANMSFDGLIPALDAGNIDAAVSGMTITEERGKKVNFTKPYYTSGLSILVKKDNETIKDVKDLEGKKLAVQIGTTGAMEAKKVKNATVREFNEASDAFMELRNGGVDAVLNDLPVNEYYLVQGGKDVAKTAGKPLTSENYGIATAKKNTELAGKIDQAIEALKKKGEYEKIYVKWFGRKP